MCIGALSVMADALGAIGSGTGKIFNLNFVKIFSLFLVFFDFYRSKYCQNFESQIRVFFLKSFSYLEFCYILILMYFQSPP